MFLRLLSLFLDVSSFMAIMSLCLLLWVPWQRRCLSACCRVWKRLLVFVSVYQHVSTSIRVCQCLSVSVGVCQHLSASIGVFLRMAASISILSAVCQTPLCANQRLLAISGWRHTENSPLIFLKLVQVCPIRSCLISLKLMQCPKIAVLVTGLTHIR